jgi:hypothetical protein
MKFLESYNNYQEDNCTYTIMQKCLKLANYECDYFYPLVFLNALQFIDMAKKITSNFVVIGTKDCFNFCEDGSQEPSETSVYYLEKIIIDVARKYPNKTFVVLHEYFNAEHLSIHNEENIILIGWSNVLDEFDDRKQIIPILNKNQNTKTVGISLNRQMRESRLCLVSYLYGLKLNKNIHISALHIQDKCNDDLLSVIPWSFENNIKFLKIAQLGLISACNDIPYLTVDEPYIHNKRISNVTNFTNRLAKLYTNSYVEIVAETLFSEKSGIITEKFLNSVYGCNFPIIISTCGTVQVLRDMGFDMFDDVIDHSYDMIESSAGRMELAINSNIMLFLNKDKTIIKWNKLLPRFKFNIKVAGQLNNWFVTHIEENFKEVVKHAL